MNNRGNKEALEQGYYDAEEALFICAEPSMRLGMKDASAGVEHDSWFVEGEVNGEHVTYSVHPTTGVEAITFEQL